MYRRCVGRSTTVHNLRKKSSRGVTTKEILLPFDTVTMLLEVSTPVLSRGVGILHMEEDGCRPRPR